MTDMNKEVIFKDGWTLDGGPITRKIAACAFDAINRGYRHGLTLEQLYYDTEMIYFNWRGTKRDIVAWYTYVSVNMMRETEEERDAVIRKILSK